MLETPGYESTNSESTCRAHVPPDKSDDLFISIVPLPADEHQRWRNARFESATNDSGSEKSMVVLYSSCAGGRHRPAKQAESKPFPSGHSLQEVDCT